jgi:putative hydrolase of the HAD superfamily
VLSNYPDGNAVRDSMAALGIIELFDTVVVSGDLGVCKPDPRPFAAVTEELGVAPDRILFVGDNWLADIQGAKRYGMRAALTTEYAPAENFRPEPGDAEPDLTIASLAELERALA